MAHIVVQKNPTGGGSVSWIDVYLHEGEKKQITATPGSRYKFSRWSVSDTHIAKLEDSNGSSDSQVYHSSTVYVVSQTESTDDKVTITAYFEEKQTLGTGTAPKINKSSSGTVRFGTTFTLTWNYISGANNYHEYTYLKGGTSALYNKSCGNTNSGTFGNWASSAIGNRYLYYIVPEDTTGAKLSPSITSCGYVDILIASQITLYQIDGTTPVSGWNGALITSWNKSNVNYSISGRQPVKWYTGKNGTGIEVSSYSMADLRNLNKSVILYAYAPPIQYTISFNANGGTSVSPASASVNAGSAYQLSQITVVPAEGKKFKGWCENANGSGTLYTTSITPSKNTTLYAIYEDNYIISYDLNPVQLIGGGTLIPSPSTIASGQKNAGQDFAITTIIPTITGHTFSCWKDLAGTTYPTGGIYTKNSGTTLQAQWTPDTYTAVLGKPIPSGAPTATLSPTSWKFNTTITLPAAPTTGYDVEKWVPQENFWKITVGDTSTVVPGGGTYNFVSALTPTVQPQWTQITYWRGGALWIYVPEEGGFLD